MQQLAVVVDLAAHISFVDAVTPLKELDSALGTWMQESVTLALACK